MEGGIRVHLWLKSLWLVATMFSAASLIWFIFGSTANFQRPLDLVNSVTLTFVGIPSLLLTATSVVLLLKKWNPAASGLAYIGFYSGVIVLLVLSMVLIKSVSSQGWLTEKVTSDSLKITSDEKYQYRIDLINLFQKNSYAKLYVKNVATNEEVSIPVDIETDKIVGLGIKETNNWVTMEPSEASNRYVLYTTKELGIPEEKFKIDIASRTSEEVK